MLSWAFGVSVRCPVLDRGYRVYSCTCSCTVCNANYGFNEIILQTGILQKFIILKVDHTLAVSVTR